MDPHDDGDYVVSRSWLSGSFRVHWVERPGMRRWLASFALECDAQEYARRCCLDRQVLFGTRAKVPTC